MKIYSTNFCKTLSLKKLSNWANRGRASKIGMVIRITQPPPKRAPKALYYIVAWARLSQITKKSATSALFSRRFRDSISFTARLSKSAVSVQQWFFVASYVLTDKNKQTEKGCGQWYTTLREVRTHQEFLVPFEAKPRLYLEFKTCSNPSKCGYHCTHSLRWAYFCPSLHTIQHDTTQSFSQF